MATDFLRDFGTSLGDLLGTVRDETGAFTPQRICVATQVLKGLAVIFARLSAGPNENAVVGKEFRQATGGNQRFWAPGGKKGQSRTQYRG
jgi:hypothetical protein